MDSRSFQNHFLQIFKFGANMPAFSKCATDIPRTTTRATLYVRSVFQTKNLLQTLPILKPDSVNFCRGTI